MDAAKLADWHLILFQVEVGDALPKNTNQKVARQLVRLGKARARDGFKTAEESFVGLVALIDGLE